jgi:hypothetical protein
MEPRRGADALVRAGPPVRGGPPHGRIIPRTSNSGHTSLLFAIEVAFADFVRTAEGDTLFSISGSLWNWGSIHASPHSAKIGVISVRKRQERLLAENPTHSFGGEAVECFHGHLQMIFAGVFDFVVADALERLDEHHHCRDAGTRDLSGVV